MQKSTSLITGIVVVIVLVIGGYALVKHNDNKTNTTNSTGYGSTASPSASSAASASGAVVMTETSSAVGSYLANANDQALYTYGGDSSGKSTVSGSLLSSWPAYAATSTTSLPTNVTVIARSDGTMQYAYKGLPLYTFVSDGKGQVTGDGVANFHIAKP